MRYILGFATGFVVGGGLTYFYGLFSWQFLVGVVVGGILFIIGCSIIEERFT